MIEMLVEAERALTHGLTDQAERLYRQVATNDPRSSIAVMGLARVALERGDDRTAYLHGRAALAIDPDNPAAQHLVMRLAEVMVGRGETPPDVAEAPPQAETPRPATPSSPAQPSTVSSTSAPSSSAPPSPPRRSKPHSPGLIGRLLRRKPRSR
jgi:cell division septation protein DedD